MRAAATVAPRSREKPPDPAHQACPLTGAPTAADPQQWLGHRLGLHFFVLPRAQFAQLRRSRTGQTQLQGVLSILYQHSKMGRIRGWKRARREICTPLVSCWGPTHPRPTPGLYLPPCPSPPHILQFLLHSFCPPKPLPGHCPATSHPSHQALDDRPQCTVPSA